MKLLIASEQRRLLCIIIADSNFLLVFALSMALITLTVERLSDQCHLKIANKYQFINDTK